MFGIHEVSMSISSALLKLESQILSYKLSKNHSFGQSFKMHK